MSMSKTLAVETYSGGSRRVAWNWTVPSFRSFFSCARWTRMSFARFRALRWRATGRVLGLNL